MMPPPISAEHARPRPAPQVRTWHWRFWGHSGAIDDADWFSARQVAIGLLRIHHGLAVRFDDDSLLVWLPIPKRERRAPRIR